MCGLILGIREDGKPIAKSILKRYHSQKSRGKEGFGYVAIEDGKICPVKHFEDEATLIDSLSKEKAQTILLHHRFPTSTDNWAELNHPIVVKNELLKHDYYVIHNGVLSNHEELFKSHDEMGFNYTTYVEKKTVLVSSARQVVQDKDYVFNDSESLAIDLALFIEGKQDKLLSRGSIAFIAIQTTKDGVVTNLFYGHNSLNPLILEGNVDKGMLFLKSEGSGVSLEIDKMYKHEWPNHAITKSDVKVGNNYSYTPQTTPSTSRGFGGAYDDDNLWDRNGIKSNQQKEDEAIFHQGRLLKSATNPSTLEEEDYVTNEDGYPTALVRDGVIIPLDELTDEEKSDWEDYNGSPWDRDGEGTLYSAKNFDEDCIKAEYEAKLTELESKISDAHEEMQFFNSLMDEANSSSEYDCAKAEYASSKLKYDRMCIEHSDLMIEMDDELDNLESAYSPKDVEVINDSDVMANKKQHDDRD